jgi:hypothetical protein
MVHIKKEYGIKIVHSSGKIEYINYESYDSAESAEYDYSRDLPYPDSQVSLVARTLIVNEWVDDIGVKPNGEASKENIIEIPDGLLVSAEELLTKINKL